MSPRPAVFLDRDGVLVEDGGYLVDVDRLRVLDGVPAALAALAAAGFALVVVTNQTVVSRGLATEEEVAGMNRALAERLRRAGGPQLDGVYVCPHHPSATVPAYRIDCDCRKPRPGLLLRAAAELDLDPAASFLVGDRPSDVTAGALAGCRTVLVTTGAHAQAPIESTLPRDAAAEPDHVCADLPAAARWILEQR